MNVEETAKALQEDLNFEAGTAKAWARSGGRCEYCDRDLIGDRFGYACSQIDHLLPRAQFPDFVSTPYDNRVLSCSLCNSLKAQYCPLKPEEVPSTMITGNRAELLSRCRGKIEQCRVDADRGWHLAKRLVLHGRR